MAVMGRRRSHWAWGYDDELASEAELRATAERTSAATGIALPGDLEAPVALERVRLPEPRMAVPPRLAAICSQRPSDRAVHAHGMAYRDLIRAFRGQFEHVPDVVAGPRDEHDVEELLAWCETAGLALIPFGGGTSVTGGVEPRVGPGYAGTVSADLSRLSRVLEADPVSGAARIQAGATGPELNAQLGSHGLMLRHFPQSYEFSTLRGWIATRSAGHYATGPTRIDDFVESVRAVTPGGIWQSRRLPGSGAGVSPDAMLLGSEGTLGVITEAWVRVQRTPAYRAAASARFGSFAAGADAVREITGSGLSPAGCRLLDPAEAVIAAGGDGQHALLMLGFESADHDVTPWLEAALKHARAYGGIWDQVQSSGPGDAGHPGGARRGAGTRQPDGTDRASATGHSGAWREAFLRMPYLRNAFPAIGLIAETFESAITWDAFPAFHQAVTGAVHEAAQQACASAVVTCRLAFAYPDGPAPYYTVLAPGRRGEEAAQWDAIKTAASDAVLRAGGTITHHHGVGRDHRPWYDRQRPEPFAAALRAAKAALDPKAILNPGVLIDPPEPCSHRPRW
jgi:alkyldihydroxyacetonephosphate synthase